MATIHPDSKMKRRGSGVRTTERPERAPQSAASPRERFERCVDLLPDRYRIVFMLRVVDGMDTTEVARALRLRRPIVVMRLLRARWLVRKMLTACTGAEMRQAFSFDGERCDRIVANVLQKVRADTPRS